MCKIHERFQLRCNDNKIAIYVRTYIRLQGLDLWFTSARVRELSPCSRSAKFVFIGLRPVFISSVMTARFVGSLTSQRHGRIFLSLWCSIILYTNEAQRYSSYALARVRKSGIENQLVTIFANSFYPSLVKYVTSSCSKGKAAESNLGKFSFSLDAIKENQIVMDIQPHPNYPLKRVRITTVAQSITGKVVNFATDIFPFADAPAEHMCERCPLNFQTRIGNLSTTLDFGLETDNQTISFVPQRDFVMSDFSLEIEVGSCSGCLESAGRVLEENLFSGREELTTFIKAFIRNRISNFILDHVGVRTTSISRIPPIISPFGRIQTDLDIESFMVTGDYIVLKGGAVFTSMLTKPAWREGRSITSRATGLGSNVRNSERTLVTCSVGASGLNALAESAWYMSWSEAQATVDLASNTNLCEPRANDQCPFPPIVAKSNTAINLALGAFFLPSGFFNEFTVFMLVPPPKFYFHENPSTISGATAAHFFIDGTSRLSGREVRLANITMPVSVAATIPSFNASTGHFHGLRIEKIRLDEPISKFSRQPYINKLAQFPFYFAKGTANAKLEELIIPEVNKNIEAALLNMPLYINPLKNVPRRGLSRHFILDSVTTFAVRQSLDGEDSHLILDADLTIKVLENPLLGPVVDESNGTPELVVGSRKGSSHQTSINGEL